MPEMLLNADGCELIIKWHKRYLYKVTLEQAAMMSEYSDNQITGFYYHETLWSDDGETIIGKGEEAIIRYLKITQNP